MYNVMNMGIKRFFLMCLIGSILCSSSALAMESGSDTGDLYSSFITVSLPNKSMLHDPAFAFAFRGLHQYMGADVEEGATLAFYHSNGCKDINCTAAGHYHYCPMGCDDLFHGHPAGGCHDPLITVSLPDESMLRDPAFAFAFRGLHQYMGADVEEGATLRFYPVDGCQDMNCEIVEHFHYCPINCANQTHCHSA